MSPALLALPLPFALLAAFGAGDLAVLAGALLLPDRRIERERKREREEETEKMTERKSERERDREKMRERKSEREREKE